MRKVHHQEQVHDVVTFVFYKKRIHAFLFLTDEVLHLLDVQCLQVKVWNICSRVRSTLQVFAFVQLYMFHGCSSQFLPALGFTL
jgi:hypothetical protein